MIGKTVKVSELAFELDISEYKKILEIQKERQKAMAEVSQILGIDVRLSDEDVSKFAQQEFAEYVQKKISKGVNSWMKSAFS